MRLRAGKRHGAGSTPGAYSETMRPLAATRRASSACDAGIVAVDPAAEDGDRRAAGVERAAMRLGVDAAREAADDDEPGRGEVAREAPRDGRAVAGASARADDRHRRLREELEVRAARARTAPPAGRGSRAAAAGSRAPTARRTGSRAPRGRRGTRARRSGAGTPPSARRSAAERDASPSRTRRPRARGQTSRSSSGER